MRGGTALNRNERLEEFIKEYSNPENFEMMLKLDGYCKDNKEILEIKMKKEFLNLFKKIKLAQEIEGENAKGKIKVITLAVSRTFAIFKDYRAIITAYDENFYFDKNPIEVTLDVSEYFSFYEELEEMLIPEVRKSMGLLNKSDIQMVMQAYFLGYVRYITNICKLVFRDVVKCEEFNLFNREDDFVVYSGEHKSNLEIVYIESYFKNEVQKKALEVVGDRSTEFLHEIFFGVDLSEKDLRNVKLNYSFLNRSNLSFSDFKLGSFVGTWFVDCDLKLTDFESALIHDANFENANLYGATFENAIGGLTKPQENCIYSPGMLGVNFEKANLEEAYFVNADLEGANFKDAKFYNNRFTNANLKNAIFSKVVVEKLELSEEQRKSIILVD